MLAVNITVEDRIGAVDLVEGGVRVHGVDQRQVVPLADCVVVHIVRRRDFERIVFFFFKQKTAYELRNVTGVQTCALPIYQDLLQHQLFHILFSYNDVHEQGAKILA